MLRPNSMTLNEMFANSERLQEAWQAVRRAGGAAGVDQQTIEEFQAKREAAIESMHRSLAAGKYRFSKLRFAVVPKPNGGNRKLGIPTVSDRVVLQSMRLVLEPEFEKVMLPCSHAYRYDRGSHTALADIRVAMQERFVFVVETDIRHFFDSIRHRPLLDQLKRVEPRVRQCRLVQDAMKAGGMEDFDISAKVLYKPLGGRGLQSPLSQSIGQTRGHLNTFAITEA